MRSDELVTAIRLAAFLPDSHVDYTSARLLLEANDALQTVFERNIVNARQGYWLKTSTQTTTAGKAAYRIPYRAVVGGLEKLEIADGTGQYINIPQCTPYEVARWEGIPGTTRGVPARYVVSGDQVRLLPAPESAGYTLRFSYYIRPSRLVTQQSSTLGGGTVRGQVTAVSPTLRTITVNVVPLDQELAAPAAVTSANQRIDVVHPGGWHELALVGATQTLAGSVFTVGGTDDMSEIEVGDFVRVAEQTDWPALPDDFHRTLADAVGAVVLTALNQTNKAGNLSQKVSADLSRLNDLMQPRVKNAPKTIIAHNSFLRRTARWR